MDEATKSRGKFVMAAIAGSTAAIGVLKSFTETATGSKFEANQFPFYLGAAAITCYFGVCAFLIVAGLVVWLLTAMGLDEDTAIRPAVALGALAGIALVYGVVSAGVMFDYDDVDSFGRTAVAVVGIGSVGFGLWYFFVRDEQKSS